MFGFGKKSQEHSDDYARGYDAAGEFLDLTLDHDLTDEEANAQWDAVEDGHSQEYVEGYKDKIFYEAEKPRWRRW